MVEVINKLNQRIIINLLDGRNLELSAKGSASIIKSDLESTHLQALIAKGSVVINTDPKINAGQSELLNTEKQSVRELINVKRPIAGPVTEVKKTKRSLMKNRR